MAVGGVSRFEAPCLYNLDGLLVQTRTKPFHPRNVICASIDCYHGPYHDRSFELGLPRLVGVVRRWAVHASRSGDTVDAGLSELGVSRFRLRRAREREERH